MTRRGFLKGLGLLLLAPTEAAVHVLRGAPVRKALEEPLWVKYNQFPIEEMLVRVQPMTRPAPGGIFFFDWKPPSLSGALSDWYSNVRSGRVQGVTLKEVDKSHRFSGGVGSIVVGREERNRP